MAWRAALGVLRRINGIDPRGCADGGLGCAAAPGRSLARSRPCEAPFVRASHAAWALVAGCGLVWLVAGRSRSPRAVAAGAFSAAAAS